MLVTTTHIAAIYAKLARLTDCHEYGSGFLHFLQLTMKPQSMLHLLFVVLSLHVAHCYFEVPAYKVDSAATGSSCQGSVEGTTYVTNCDVPRRGGERCCGVYSVNTIDYAAGAFCSNFRMRCQHPFASIACYLFPNATAATMWSGGSTYIPAAGSYIAGCNASRECIAVGALPNANTVAPTFAVTVGTSSNQQVRIVHGDVLPKDLIT